MFKVRIRPRNTVLPKFGCHPSWMQPAVLQVGALVAGFASQPLRGLFLTLFHAEERGYIVYGKVYVLRLTIGEGKDETSLDVTINQYAAVKRSEKERERIEKLMKINPLVLELLRIIRYCMKQWNLPGTQGGGSPSFFWRDWILEILETKLNKKRMKTLKDSDSDVFTTVLRYFFNTGLLSTERSDEKFNPFRSASECAPGVKLEYTVRFNWAWRELEMLQGNRSNDQTLERLCLDKPLVARWQHLAGNGSRKAPCGSGEGVASDTIRPRDLVRKMDMEVVLAAECIQEIQEIVETANEQGKEMLRVQKAEDHAKANKLQPAELLEGKTRGKKEKDKTVYTLALGARKADGLQRVLGLLASWVDRDDLTRMERRPRKRFRDFVEGQLGRAENWANCVAIYDMFPGSKHHDNPKKDSMGQVIMLVAQLLVGDKDSSSLLFMDFQKTRKTNKDHPAHERDLVSGCIIEFSLNERFQMPSKYQYACLAFPAKCQQLLDELFPADKCDARRAEQVTTEVPLLAKGYVVKVVEREELDRVARVQRVTTSPVKSEDRKRACTQHLNGQSHVRVRSLILKHCRCSSGQCFRKFQGCEAALLKFLSVFWNLKKTLQDAYVPGLKYENAELPRG
eukprot:s1005_g21.t1